jgi:hypothetical protein
MNLQELLVLLQHYEPTWTKEGRLTCVVEIDEALLAFIQGDSAPLVFEELCQIKGDKKKRRLSSITDVFIGKIINVTVRQEVDNAPIFSSIEVLAKKYPVWNPARFVIFNNSNMSYAFDGTNEPQSATGQVKHYLQICRIWQQLKEYCDHTSSTSEMTFLYRKKLSIKSRYSQSILENEFDGLERFSRILSDLDNDSHKEGKNHILQNTLVSVLGNIQENDRFEYLLTNFTKFTSKFDDSYHAYVVGFSFDKLRKEHEERYREYMVKINDVVSSSLTKALMIPGALYLTTTRTQAIQTVKGASTITDKTSEVAVVSIVEASTVNLGIGVAAFSICIIYWWILSNESNSVDAVKVEYESLMGRLKDKSPDASKTIEDFVDTLRNKIKGAKRTIISLKAVNVLAFGASLEWLMANTYGYTLISKIWPYLVSIINLLKLAISSWFS